MNRKQKLQSETTTARPSRNGTSTPDEAGTIRSQQAKAAIQKTHNIDPKLQEFLEVVDCEPWEVLNTPPDRQLTTEKLKHECEHSDPEALRNSLGGKEVYFGMHRGKRLKDIPLSYFEWALSQKPTSKAFRRFQRDVQQFLGRDGSRDEVELRDPLTQEFLAIVRDPCPAARQSAAKF